MGSHSVAVGTDHVAFGDFRTERLLRTTFPLGNLKQFPFARSVIKVQSFLMGAITTIHTSHAKFEFSKPQRSSLLPRSLMTIDRRLIIFVPPL